MSKKGENPILISRTLIDGSTVFLAEKLLVNFASNLLNNEKLNYRMMRKYSFTQNTFSPGLYIELVCIKIRMMIYMNTRWLQGEQLNIV